MFSSRAASPLARCLTPLLFLLLLATVSAHEVIVEQVVEMTVAPQGDHLLVRLHVPMMLVGKAKDLPPDVIAADIAHTLDIQQAEMTLPPPLATARVAADRTSIEVELRYASRAEWTEFSARLNAFDATGGPVRTNARFQQGTGPDHVLSVTGPALRVRFDPHPWVVAQQFVARGVRALTDGGDHLLLLLCVLLPMRRARAAAALFLAAALGQTMTIALAVAQPSVTPESLAAIGMVAASVVVVATLQNVVRAHLRWVVVLAFAFGALDGFVFGSTLSESTQFAGLHQSIAVATFVLVVLVGELWFGALAWGTRVWLDERGVPERVMTLIASGIIAHSAVHRLFDRGHIVAQAGSFTAERALVWLTLGWACVMLLVAIGNAVSGRSLEADGVQSP